VTYSQNAPVNAIFNYFKGDKLLMCTNSSFDVVSLCSSTLSELVFPLVKILLESWNSYFGMLFSMAVTYLNVDNVWKSCSSKQSSVFGKVKSFTAPNKVDDHILLPIFG
jgi:hypothetical protein